MFGGLDRNGVGSSPLTRGARRPLRRAAWADGLIPAHAGSTGKRPSRRTGSRAHPRSRGEHNLNNQEETMEQGSSPLTRGAPGSGRAGELAVGLIPAHAGSTPPFGVALLASWAHPRSRGEHALSRAVRDGIQGSSPLTRGAPLCPGCPLVSVGLIPAHAGSTRHLSECSTTQRAHPRSRGEHVDVHCRALSRWGSSPLTRGARAWPSPWKPASGLIPAHAGSTQGRTCWRSVGRAHPRSRGEHFFKEQLTQRDQGSSPLTRGAR